MTLSGNLKDFNITNLIQLNCIENNTAQIVINWKGHEASIFILDGNIIHAKFRELKGEPALYRILRLEEGEFSITRPKAMPHRTIHDSWNGLLLEGARVQDESEREKDTIVRSLAMDLGRHPQIKKLLIITRGGDCVQNSGFDSPERYVAVASAFHKKSNQLAVSLAIGDIAYTSFSIDKDNVFFFECDNFFIVVEMGREANIRRLIELVSELKEKLQVAEVQPG
jgi:hypothetical protein